MRVLRGGVVNRCADLNVMGGGAGVFVGVHWNLNGVNWNGVNVNRVNLNGVNLSKLSLWFLQLSVTSVSSQVICYIG